MVFLERAVKEGHIGTLSAENYVIDNNSEMQRRRISIALERVANEQNESNIEPLKFERLPPRDEPASRVETGSKPHVSGETSAADSSTLDSTRADSASPHERPAQPFNVSLPHTSRANAAGGARSRSRPGLSKLWNFPIYPGQEPMALKRELTSLMHEERALVNEIAALECAIGKPRRPGVVHSLSELDL